MTVAELIERLHELPPDLVVLKKGTTGAYSGVSSPFVEKAPAGMLGDRVDAVVI